MIAKISLRSAGTVARARIAIVSLQLAALAIYTFPQFHLPLRWTGGSFAIVLVIPPFAVAAIGYMRWPVLSIWLLASTTIVVGLMSWLESGMDRSLSPPVAVLGLVLNLALAAFVVLVGHCCVVAGEMDRQWIARPSTYAKVFGIMLAQGLIAMVSVMAFWSLVILIGTRFGLMERMLDAFGWGAVPLTMLLGSLIFHVVDSRWARAKLSRSEVS